MLKAERREAKQQKREQGMRVSGRSVKTLLANKTGSSAIAARRKKAAVLKRKRGK